MDRLIVAKYELRAEIGRGPHGVVWRARHRGTGEECAVKVLHERFASDSAVVERFVQNEAVLTAFLHPAYVRVRELVIDPEHLALVAELVDGIDMRRRLAASGPIAPRLAAAITAGAALAIAAGHEAGVVHSNIQPSNVILVGGAGRVRITDCRVARLARGFGDMGDDAYAAPEVRSGGTAVRATDVYGLGLILYEALTATLPPTTGGRIADLALPTSIGSGFREVLERCLATNPDDRMTASQLAADLRELADFPESVPDAPQVPVNGHTLKAVTAEPAWLSDAPAEPPTVARDSKQIHARPSQRSLPRGPLLAGATLVVLMMAALIVVLPRMATDGPAGVVSIPRSGPSAIVPRASDAAPTLPAAAAVHSAAGATAFVSYWFDTLSYGMQTGDHSAFQAASSPGCVICKAASTSIDEGYQPGQSVQGGTYTVRSVQADSFFDLSRPVLRVVYDRTTRSTVDIRGRVIATLAGITFGGCQIVLERADTQWRVLDVQASTPMV